MPYYSVRLIGGSRSDHLELKSLFNGRDTDHTGHFEYFYVERRYDLRTMQRNAQSAAGKAIVVEVGEISAEEYNWRAAR